MFFYPYPGLCLSEVPYHLVDVETGLSSHKRYYEFSAELGIKGSFCLPEYCLRDVDLGTGNPEFRAVKQCYLDGPFNWDYLLRPRGLGKQQ